jgi:hypothetical protein
MNGKIPAILFLLILGAIAASGCVTDCGGCEDECLGKVLLRDGYCSMGDCRYITEFCDFGCEDAACLQRPPHLSLSDNPQTKNNFTLNISESVVAAGDRYDKDDYVLKLRITNRGAEDEIYSVSSASVLTLSGIMYTTAGFSWSDLVEEGGDKTISLEIRGVPKATRDENSTLLVRTNKGFYYFPATVEP